MYKPGSRKIGVASERGSAGGRHGARWIDQSPAPLPVHPEVASVAEGEPGGSRQGGGAT
jgi:hypothetical protein